MDHPPSKDELCRIYEAAAESDPGSIHYKRINIRPRIRWGKALLFLFLVFLLSSSVGMASFFIFQAPLVGFFSALGLFLLLFILFAKRIAIWFIQLYQRFAPDKVRDKCRFEPTCSTYMIMAIRKYGLIVGLCKGIKRISRCKPPNGGIDYP